MRKEEIDRWAVFKIWIWRMMKISLMKRKSNEEILGLVGEERFMLEVLAKKKKAWIGCHVLREDMLLETVIEGRMYGKRPRGRPIMGMMDDIMR